MRHEVAAVDERRHGVELDVRPDDPGTVRVGVLRASRREAKSDRALVLTAAAARELMRALQSAADEADRRAYQAAKDLLEPEGLDGAVAAVARALAG